MENLLNNLNDRQLEAVKTTEGPVLVVAGAGSGKTTVIVNRIAYIIHHNMVRPGNILAITFTNKAAREMRERVETLLGDTAAGLWIGTFHSMCVRILRTCIDLLGYTRDFIIFDSSDTRTVMKECLRELNFDEKNFPPRSILSIISNAKNDMMDYETFENVYRNDFRMSKVAEIYRLYQSKLKRNNALDFDDIILNTVKVLSLNEDVKLYYQGKFEYVLVDEYQDTNNAQYMLIRLLSDGYKNICAVGDDDQSIYKFRGANIANILRFEEDFENTVRITLDRNYRSTQTILDAANAVIAHNGKRMEKQLWTDKGAGNPIFSYTAENEYGEGQFIASKIKNYYEEGGNFSDCAILYRTNAQSRVLEEQLMREAVPYRVLAGLRFYDRKEIKDIISYLRLVLNQNDDVSLKRVINEPKRKIGAATVDKAEKIAMREDKSIYEVISEADNYEELRVAAPKLKAFVGIMDGLIKLRDHIPLTELTRRILTDTGYSAALTAADDIESKTRLENLDEFLNAVQEFEKSDEYSGKLNEFLETITLVADVDAYDEDQDAVVMMTIHSSKGLEFPRVFIAGMEEGLFPGMRSIEGGIEEIEEERRLCYVAMTRAKEYLCITQTAHRNLYGKTLTSRPSRFYQEIPMEYIEDVSGIRRKTVSFAQKFERSFKKFERAIPKTEPAAAPAAGKSFSAGDIVEHRKFGKGIILSVQEFGKDAILEIQFDSIGHKRLMAAFAKLKKL